MDYQEQLKLQAYLDGELPEAEAKAVAELLTKDQQAAALLTELRQTTESLAGFEQSIPLPESREFFWSKVRRGIEAQELRVEAAEARPTVSWSARLRRFLMPAAGVATTGPGTTPCSAPAETDARDRP